MKFYVTQTRIDMNTGKPEGTPDYLGPSAEGSPFSYLWHKPKFKSIIFSSKKKAEEAVRLLKEDLIRWANKCGYPDHIDFIRVGDTFIQKESFDFSFRIILIEIRPVEDST